MNETVNDTITCTLIHFCVKMRINNIDTVIKFGYYQVRQSESLQMKLKMETSFSKCILCFLLEYSLQWGPGSARLA